MVLPHAQPYSSPRGDAHRGPSSASQRPARAAHEKRRDGFAREIERHEARANRLSLVRLVSFLAGVILLVAGFTDDQTILLVLGALALLAFAVAVIMHQRVIGHRELARIRRDIHVRHLRRLDGDWTEFPDDGQLWLQEDHAYAADIDVVGPGSLFQRIDTSHTELGAQRLAAWLGRAADPATIRARQQAVRELADNLAFRQELEASALRSGSSQRLSGRGLSDVDTLALLFERRPWLNAVIWGLPALTLATYLAGAAAWIPSTLWLVPLLAHLVVLRAHGPAIRRAFDVLSARQSVVEAFEHMLLLVEQSSFDSPLLQELQRKLALEDRPPSAHMRRLQRWVGFAELRQQFLLHVIVNPLLLWDLHVLRGLEGWVRDVGTRSQVWFETLADLEALSALAGFAHGDPEAVFAELAEPGQAFEAEGLNHPLLMPGGRVSNDVRVGGSGHVVIVTGSNMAGKSTLLRAVGLNIVLALAGGAACARRFRVPPVRLRASMRAHDSLQRGASYFHAELQKLRSVVGDAEASPPVFFLLDELLRGTNARARHIGGQAVLLHLMERGAMGMVATHDVELAKLQERDPEHFSNVHFTDVMVDGEMTFDYRLRPGVVRTSNALRLLGMAGIEVPEDDTLDTGEEPA